MPHRRSVLPAVLLLLLLSPLPNAAAAQLALGRYQSRPGGALLRCGGIAGTCGAGVLEGSLVVETTGPVPAGTDPVFVITASDLRLHGLVAGVVEPYPPPGALPLVGLEGSAAFESVVFASPPGSRFDVELELFPGGESFVLRGSYLGIGDFGDEILAVTFDWTGPDPQPALLLDDGRFAVRAVWDAQGRSGTGTPVRTDGLSGTFWFFRPDNPELLVKIVPACVPPFERVWFFAGGLTNVGVTLSVFDREHPLEAEKVYVNPPGRRFATILDTDGFPCTSLP